MRENIKKRTLRMTFAAVLAAISVVLVAFVAIPLVPAAPYLKYDMADVPILLGTLICGTPVGLCILFVVSVIQAFLFGGDGWIGLVMHFVASGALVLLTGLFYSRKRKYTDMIIGLVLGSIAMTLIMIPMNYIFTVNFYGVPKETVDAMLLPGIIPFNLFKAGLNSILAGVLFRALAPVLSMTNLRG